MLLTTRDFILGIVVMFWAFLAPIHSLLLITGSLVIIDLITGIWKAITLKEKITSYKLRQTITKGAAYMIAILVGLLLDTVTGSAAMISRTVGGLVALVEAKSCFENLGMITNIDIWKAVLDKLQPPKDPPQ